jgi:hypothetical protein
MSFKVKRKNGRGQYYYSSVGRRLNKWEEFQNKYLPDWLPRVNVTIYDPWIAAAFVASLTAGVCYAIVSFL